MITSAEDLARQIRRDHLHKPFGIIQFFGMGVVRPNDQSYELVSTHAEGDRLDLVFEHQGHSGQPGLISLWEPGGLEPAPAGLGQGLAIRVAARLRMDDNEATRVGEQFRMRTARGEGTLPIDGEPALVLAR